MLLANTLIKSQMEANKLASNNVYLICECGDNFPNEAAYQVHLEEEHGVWRNGPKVIIQKQNYLEDDVSSIIVYPDIVGTPLDQPRYFNEMVKDPEYAVEYIIKSEEDTSGDDVDVKEERISAEDEVPMQHAEDINEMSYHTIATFRNRLKREHNYDKGQRDQEFFCELCGQSFPSPRSVHQHAARRHAAEWRAARRTRPRIQPKKIACDLCGKTYPSRTALQYHMYTHTGERPFECPTCPKRFTTPTYLQLHVRSHTGERPAVCMHCPKAFTGRAALQRHERVHTGEKPYLCAECGKSFSQSNSRKLHVRTVHRRLPAPYKSRARKLKVGNVRKAKSKAVKTETHDEYDVEYIVHGSGWAKLSKLLLNSSVDVE